MKVSAAGPAAKALRFELVVVVASLGGLAAVSTVLGGLPGAFPVPLLLVQHSRGGDDLDRLSRLLQKITSLPVRTARSGVCARGPGVTVIPGGFTATLDHQHQLTLTVGPGQLPVWATALLVTGSKPM
jgi:two-component system chemotaxis response regulator CheB